MRAAGKWVRSATRPAPVAQAETRVMEYVSEFDADPAMAKCIRAITMQAPERPCSRGRVPALATIDACVCVWVWTFP